MAASLTQELKDGEEVWRFALDGSGDGVWDWNLQTNQVNFSDRWKEIIGHAPNEILNHFDEWKKRVHPQDLPHVVADIEAYLKGATSKYANEHRMLCNDGSWKWVLARGMLVSRTEEGLPLRMVGTHTDITERRQTEEKLKLAALVYQNAEEAMTVTDAAGTIITVNPAFTRLTGYAAEEVVGQNPRILKSGRHDMPFYEAMWHSINTKGHWQGEIWNRRKNGEIYPEWLSINAAYNSDGTVHRYVAMFQDITQEKEAEETIRALSANHIAVREEEGKRIAREIHDELGQRLTLLRMDVLMLPKTLGVQGEKLKEAVNRMKGAIDGCISIARDIVADMRPAVLDIGIIPAIEWLLEEFQSRTGIECHFHNLLEGELALSDQQATGIFRILQESLTNVAKHANARQVEVALESSDDQISLEIADNGIGIKSAKMRNAKSYGLIGIRERAAMLGGKFTISGQPGKGTSLRLSIPLSSLTIHYNPTFS